MKRRFLSITFICIIFIVTGCNIQNDKNKITLDGDYYVTEPKTDETSFWNFSKRGTVVVKEHNSYEICENEEGKFIILYDEAKKKEIRQLKVEQEEEGYSIYDCPQEKKAEKSNPSMVTLKEGEDGLKNSQLFDGVYCLENKEEAYRFTKDGIVDVRIMKYDYSMDKEHITLKARDGREKYSYTLSDDSNKLTISLSDEKKIEFEKK